MKALILEDYRRFAYATAPDPAPGPGEVLIAVQACGICGSDVHGMDGSTGRRRPPIIMGHEAAGTIAAVGSGVAAWKPGDRVTFDSTIYCGTCAYCRRGQINLCDNRRVLGVSCEDYRQHGAFAEYVAVPQHILYRLPGDLSFDQAALVEPVSIAFHAINRTSISLNDSAIVFGAGMIGLLVIQALRLAGCGVIIAVDLEDSKLALAKQLGADHAFNAADPQLSARVLDLTGGQGADHALECVGIGATVSAAFQCVRKGGSITLVGNLSPRIDFPLQAAVTREITLNGVCASQGEYPACLDMIARGAIDVKPLMSAVAPLSEGAAWFERLYNKEPGLMKVVLAPDGA
ncbi:MAG: galactitol-1-phosphate 5-dehydrogenase [Candidatus Hydrogenedentes bacterium]|nr:galactitol-1-phosphate 5-dehydrogenase [Candidatus Hydrogenedentota bacterium]